jgi:hypothetical protein
MSFCNTRFIPDVGLVWPKHVAGIKLLFVSPETSDIPLLLWKCKKKKKVRGGRYNILGKFII